MENGDTKTLTLTCDEMRALQTALRIRIRLLRDDIARYDLSTDCKEYLYTELDEYEALKDKVREKLY